MCKHVPGYFPATLYVEDIKDFIHDQAYVFGYEPHSLWPVGAGTLLALTNFISNGKVKVLASTAVAFLKTRKGFIRLAMETNSPLVPVFAFGQNMFKCCSPMFITDGKPRGRLFLKLSRAIKFTPIVFLGSTIPLRRPILVVVGNQCISRRILHPPWYSSYNSCFPRVVSEVHGQFVKALRSLFKRHKARAGYPLILYLEFMFSCFIFYIKQLQKYIISIFVNFYKFTFDEVSLNDKMFHYDL
uniref:Putative diacylglycerol acyltransferase n=1 Tax=Helianthus annuus TaxID=4232 RepID=A0A251VEV6_HELAN